MRRGEIRLVDLDPTKGSEANKRRPAVVVSNDGANAVADRLGRGVVTIVPVTSSVATVHPFQVFLPASECGLRQDSKAQAEQVRSVTVNGLGSFRRASCRWRSSTRSPGMQWRRNWNSSTVQVDWVSRQAWRISARVGRYMSSLLGGKRKSRQVPEGPRRRDD